MKSAIDRRIGELGEPRHLVLGLDPGIASCGFALIDTANQEILEMGSRLFDAPIVPKTKQSKAAVRRGFRSTRRNLDRTQNRLKHCRKLLAENGIIPQDATAEYFHSVKGDLQPLQLRVQGLDRLLTDREWALVLYSLCKRRGYIPHGEGDGGNDEDGKVLKAISQNKKLLESGSFRTVAEWLNTLEKSRNRSGSYDRCVTHAQLTDELNLLFERQASFGNPYTGKALKDKYLEIYDWQKPRDAFDEKTYSLVGNCVYFPNEKRAARCTLTSELVAAYGAFGNVIILLSDGTTRTLTSQERDEFIRTLFSPAPIRGNKECKVTFASIRKRLDLNARDAFKGVGQDDEKTREVYRPQGWRALRKILFEHDPDLLLCLADNRDLADAVFEAIAYSSSSDVLRRQLDKLELSETDVTALCRMPYSSRVLNGYGARSKRALDILLDSFVDSAILTLTDAENASGLYGLRTSLSKSIEPNDRLMPYEAWLALTGRTNNNPVVIRAMAQMRKVINAICSEWGVPDEIHVELARDLALSKKAKDRIAQSNRKNEKDNERIRKQISELTGWQVESVKPALVNKWKLWEEQDNCDIYTGDGIELMRLLTDDTYTQIDHILPFSRTGDNSRHNKVLVLSRSNQLKRESTPYEWMHSNQDSAPNWDSFAARVQENRKLSPRKKAFLLESDLFAKEGDFQSRNLNDTRYMAREVCAYVNDCLAFPDNGMKAHVVPTKGAASAWLRHAWGLNFGAKGEKDRSDDRHHATDACVIAACTRSLVIKTAKFSEQKHFVDQHERDELLARCMPWTSFADDVRKRRETVLPTRYVPRKSGGELFEQTVYAYAGVNEQGKDLLRNKQGKIAPAGNAIVSADGKSAIKVGDMLCLRLWHDPAARKGRGQWYADPVYKADLPALRNGSYVPRIAKAHSGRKTWKPIPEDVLAGKPLVLYLGDAIRVGDMVGRFAGYNIDNANWSMVDALSSEPLKAIPVGKLTNDLIPVRIHEDILGRCWENLPESPSVIDE